MRAAAAGVSTPCRRSTSHSRERRMSAVALRATRPCPRELGGREVAEALADGRQAQVAVSLAGAAQEPRFQLPRRPRLDQLPADGLEEGMRDRRRPQRPQPAKAADRLAEQGSPAKRRSELRVVVVRGEDEAQALERGPRPLPFDLGGEAAVGALAHAGDRRPALGLERHRQDSVTEMARRIAPHPGGEGERVGRAGDDVSSRGPPAPSLTRAGNGSHSPNIPRYHRWQLSRTGVLCGGVSLPA